MNLDYQITKCVNFSEYLEIQFFKVFLQLNKTCCATYMSYTFDKGNIRFSFRSDSSWAAFYENTMLFGKPVMELCPLDRASRTLKNNILIWDLYNQIGQHKLQREIMEVRNDHSLYHGVTLTSYFDVHNDAIAIATDDKKNDLASRVLMDNCGAILKQSLLLCRSKLFLSHENGEV